MTSLILRTTTRYLIPFLLLFSIFLLVRGHNQPGGGFAGGLVASAAFALASIAFGAAKARQILRVDPRFLIGLGLFTALSSGILSLFNQQPFLTGLWGYIWLPGQAKVEIGSPVLFDLGVFLVVVGVTLTIVFTLEEAE